MKITHVFLATLMIISCGKTQSETSLEGVVEQVRAETVEGKDDKVISSGTWAKKNFEVAGSWTISSQNGQTTVSLDDAFSTKQAPDLKIFLSPLAVSELDNKNAVRGSLLVSPLSANKGTQSYSIEAGTDLSAYKSIIIHCEAYSKLWSAADL